jgi:hypothetical protein
MRKIVIGLGAALLLAGCNSKQSVQHTSVSDAWDSTKQMSATIPSKVGTGFRDMGHSVKGVWETKVMGEDADGDSSNSDS